MDETDRRLIELLRADARAPTAAIARRLGLSRTTVQSRIERLERSGAIAGYTVKLPRPDGGGMAAFVMITLAHKESAKAIAAIGKLAEVRRLVSVSGPFDLLAEVKAPTVAELDGAIDALGAIAGVERTTTAIALSAKIER